MKKVRIMLATMIVLGSVGGALGLKAKKFGADTYCTTTQGGQFCRVLLQNATFAAGGAIKYRKVAPGTPNCGDLICTSIGLVNE